MENLKQPEPEINKENIAFANSVSDEILRFTPEDQYEILQKIEYNINNYYNNQIDELRFNLERKIKDYDLFKGNDVKCKNY